MAVNFDWQNKMVQRFDAVPQIAGSRKLVFFTMAIPAAFNQLAYFTSGWGQEWTELQVDLAVNSDFAFANLAGRSSAQYMPFFSLANVSGAYLDFAIGTSGNYEVRFVPAGRGWQLQIGYPLAEGEALPTDFSVFKQLYVLVHYCADDAARYSVKHGYTEASRGIEVADFGPLYNHWWAYEDKHVNEAVILENAKISKDIGLDMMMLDAGWFGHPLLDEEWFNVRGDWVLENTARFPDGIEHVSAVIRNSGLKFGIWCEIEGLGQDAVLNRQRPELAAVRGTDPLGYVCLATDAAQEWAFATLQKLIVDKHVEYLKLDFNLDPGFGCDCSEHWHGGSDGLLKHYQGLYRVLDQLKAEFPALIIENCSSGGQRFDVEMFRHSDVHFLCDPDDIDRHFNCFHHASLWFHPRRLLHFMWSNTVTTNDAAPFPSLDLETLPEHEIKYYLHSVWMHKWGLSHHLPEYSPRVLAIVHEEIDYYKQFVRSIVSQAEYWPLHFSEELKVFAFDLSGEKAGYFVFSTGKQNIQLPANGWQQAVVHGDDWVWQLTHDELLLEAPAGLYSAIVWLSN